MKQKERNMLKNAIEKLCDDSYKYGVIKNKLHSLTAIVTAFCDDGDAEKLVDEFINWENPK